MGAASEARRSWYQFDNQPRGTPPDTYRIHLIPSDDSLQAAVRLVRRAVSRMEAPDVIVKYLNERVANDDPSLIIGVRTLEDLVTMIKLLSEEPDYGSFRPRLLLPFKLPVLNTPEPWVTVTAGGSSDAQLSSILIARMEEIVLRH